MSSVALARTREALNNSWDKNDPKDAQVILHMMQIGNDPDLAPVQPDQPQQAFHKARGLPQRQAKQDFQRKTGLACCCRPRLPLGRGT